MAALPPIKRFLAEDFPSQKSWIGSFLYPLNLFLNAVYGSLNNGLTINQNMIALVKTVSQIQMSGTTTLTGQTTINWPYPQSAPVGLQVLQQYLVGTGVQVYPTISWSYANGVVTINLSTPNPTGSSQTTLTYNTTFWVTGG